SSATLNTRYTKLLTYVNNLKLYDTIYQSMATGLAIQPNPIFRLSTGPKMDSAPEQITIGKILYQYTKRANLDLILTAQQRNEIATRISNIISRINNAFGFINVDNVPANLNNNQR